MVLLQSISAHAGLLNASRGSGELRTLELFTCEKTNEFYLDFFGF